LTTHVDETSHVMITCMWDAKMGSITYSHTFYLAGNFVGI